MDTKQDFDATWAVFLRIKRDEGKDAAWEWLRIKWLCEAAKERDNEHK